jgi:hypothetical protein
MGLSLEFEVNQKKCISLGINPDFTFTGLAGDPAGEGIQVTLRPLANRLPGSEARKQRSGGSSTALNPFHAKQRFEE